MSRAYDHILFFSDDEPLNVYSVLQERTVIDPWMLDPLQ